MSPTFHLSLYLCLLPCDFAALSLKGGIYFISFESCVLLCTIECGESDGVLAISLGLKIPFMLPLSS